MSGSEASMTEETTTTEVETVTPWTMAEAIIDVTGYLAQPTRFLRLGKELIAAGATPVDVRRLYGLGGRYWLEDWRGKNGQRPSEHAIRETVTEYLHAGPVARPAAQPKSAGALAEYMQRTGATMGGEG